MNSTLVKEVKFQNRQRIMTFSKDEAKLYGIENNSILEISIKSVDGKLLSDILYQKQSSPQSE